MVETDMAIGEADITLGDEEKVEYCGLTKGKLARCSNYGGTF